MRRHDYIGGHEAAVGFDFPGDTHWYRWGGAAAPGSWVIASYRTMPPRFARAVVDDFGNLVGVSS